MSKSANRRQYVDFFRRAGGRIVWVCLFLALWRSPVPCFHIHDGIAPGGDLTVHLARYHSRPDLEAHGWHLHFVALRDLFRGGGCPVPDNSEYPHPDDMPVVPSLVELLDAPAFSPSFLPVSFGERSSTLPTGDSDSACEAGDRTTNGECILPTRRRLPMLCVARC